MLRVEAERKAAEIVGELTPYCWKVGIGGSLLCGHPAHGEIVIVMVPKIADDTDLLGKTTEVDLALEHMESSGAVLLPRKKTIYAWRGCHVRVVKTTKAGWVSSVLFTTMGKSLLAAVMCSSKTLGVRWSVGAGVVEYPTGELLVKIRKEADLFAALKLPYVEPSDRNLDVIYQLGQSGRKLPMIGVEFAEWVDSCVWVDTMCGGEWHQYTHRGCGSDDEREFLRVVEMIRKFGYDGEYLGARWRYLDFKGMRYFSWGADPYVTILINRKPLLSREKERPWTPVKLPFRCRTIDARLTSAQRKLIE